MTTEYKGYPCCLLLVGNDGASDTPCNESVPTHQPRIRRAFGRVICEVLNATYPGLRGATNWYLVASVQQHWQQKFITRDPFKLLTRRVDSGRLLDLPYLRQRRNESISQLRSHTVEQMIEIRQSNEAGRRWVCGVGDSEAHAGFSGATWQRASGS